MKIGNKVLGVKIIGDDSYIDNCSTEDIYLVNGVGSAGSMGLRKSIYDKFKEKYSFATVIHPSTIISSNVELAEGVQVMAGAIIQPGCYIGINSIINTGASIDHDCCIGCHVHIAPGCILSGTVSIGCCTHIGTGCVVIQGKTIGHNTLVGAGSLILHNVKSDIMAFGVPARERHYESMGNV